MDTTSVRTAPARDTSTRDALVSVFGEDLPTWAADLTGSERSASASHAGEPIAVPVVAPRASTGTAAVVREAIATLEGEPVPVPDVAIEPTPAAERSTLTARPPVSRPSGELYYPRALAGGWDVDQLRALRAATMHTLLYSPPGTGKTALLEAAFGDDLVTFEGHGDAQVEDLVGGWRPRLDGGYEWADGPLPRAMEEGKPLFVDDATLTPPGVLARLYPAMDGRRQIRLTEHRADRVVTARPGFVVVGAHNPGVAEAVLTEALSSRFLVQIEMQTDFDRAARITGETALVRMAQKMDNLRETGSLTWAPQMRELLAFKTVRDVLGLPAAIGNLVNCAPEEERTDLINRLGTLYGNVTGLRVGHPAR